MKKILACIAALVIFALPALAVVQPGNDFYVLDDADVLSDATEGMIVFSNDLLEADCGAQFVVVTLETTGDEDIEDYAYELFNEWGIGDKKANNGFLLLLATGDEDYYYLPGAGLDYDLSGGRLRAIIDEYLEPYFAEGAYDKGVAESFEQIFAKIADACDSDVTVSDGKKAYEAWLKEADSQDDVNEDAPVRNQEMEDEPEKKKGGFPAWLIIVVIVVILLVVNGRNRRRRGATFFPVLINTARRAPRAPRPPRAPRHIHIPTVPPVHRSAPRTMSAPRPRTGGGGRSAGGGMGRNTFSASRPATRTRSSFGSSVSRGRSGFGGGRSGGGGMSRGGGGRRGR